jgi:precorrin-2 dehydrogenase/sirohydrochlorin ferrochelatase
MELEETYGPEYDILVRILGKLREKVIVWGDSPEENRQIFEAVIESDILDLIRKKDWPGVKKLIWERTGETLDDFGGDA